MSSSSSTGFTIPPIDIRKKPTLKIANREYVFEDGTWDECFFFAL